MKTTRLLFASSVLAVLAAGCDPFAFIGDGTGGSSTVEIASTCNETAACPMSQPCLAPVENVGLQVFGLRIAELDFSLPTRFQPDSNGPVINGLFHPDLSSCGLGSGGNTAALLRVDLTNDTLTFGGAIPPADPTAIYTFANASATLGSETVEASSVTTPFTRGSDGSLATTPVDVILPIWLDGSTDANGEPVSPQAFPIHELSFHGVALSSSNDCVGRVLPSLLDPSQGCSGGADALQFEHAGTLSGYITLEEADTFMVLGETMCVLLAGGEAKYANSSDPDLTTCARENGAIVFHGDWCSKTNSPATATCFDAVFLSASFAANAARL